MRDSGFKNRIWIIAAVLSLLLIMSLGVLSERMGIFHKKADIKIDLFQTEITGSGNVAAEEKKTASASTLSTAKKDTATASSMTAVKTETKTYRIKDEEIIEDPSINVWKSYETFSLFSPTYKGTTGHWGDITVNPNKGHEENLIAPGTEQNYLIELEHTKKGEARYWVYVKSAFYWADEYDDETYLPVELGFTSEGNAVPYLPVAEYYEPDAEKYGKLCAEGILTSGEKAYYDLAWKWIFERGGDPEDIYDTSLGDVLDEDLDLVVTVTVITELDESVPHTGDTQNTWIWAGIFIVSLLLLILLLVFMKKRKNDQDQV